MREFHSSARHLTAPPAVQYPLLPSSAPREVQGQTGDQAHTPSLRQAGTAIVTPCPDDLRRDSLLRPEYAALAHVTETDGSSRFLSPGATSRLADDIAANQSSTPIEWGHFHSNATPPPKPPLHRIRLGLTHAATQLLLRLQQGELLFPPLEMGGVAELVAQLSDMASDCFGGVLSEGVAMAALELSRYSPDAQGWPSVEEAFGYLQVRSSSATRPSPTAEHPSTPPLSTTTVNPAFNSSRPAPPRQPPSSETLLQNSLRFRRKQGGVITAPLPDARDRCASCNARGHHALRCPKGVDVTCLVDAAVDLSHAVRERVAELSANESELGAAITQEALQAHEGAAKCEAVDAIANLSGIAASDVSSVWDALGDPGVALVAAVCRSRARGDRAVQLENQCRHELARRRQSSEAKSHSRDSSLQGDSSARYAALSSRINLPSRLGYNYRVDTSGIELPPFPKQPPKSTIRRHRDKDDLSDLVTSDHTSESESSPPARSHRDSPPSKHSKHKSTSQSDSSDPSSEESDSSFSSESGSASGGRDSEKRTSRGSAVDSEDSSGSSSPDASNGRWGNSSQPADVPAVVDGPLTASALTALVAALTKRLEKRSEGNGNGMLASKPPSFWTIGKPPSGGYFPETFNRIYHEYRQFRSVFGKNTGLSFKRLITEELQPTVRRDLKLSRHQFRKIDSGELVKKLKKRLCFHKRDVYVAELEACPRIPAGIKDMHTLNLAFKDLSSKMLDVVERAHRHGVRLRKSSCKHILGQAVKNSYRLTQWFHLSRFRSIGESVRRINTKLQRRMSTDAEKRHEQLADQAIHNGIRQQLGDGTVESSGAPERPRKGSGKPSPKGGIKKGDAPRLSPEEYAKKMDALYRVENELEKGRYFHKHGPFCNSPTNCTLKFCQGCGEHQVPNKPWHDRPKCRCRKDRDFVATGYWHDKWPNRLNLKARPSGQGEQRTAAPTNRDATKKTEFAARANQVSQPTAVAEEAESRQQ